MKYIKKFANDADYQQFVGGGDYVTPNICLNIETMKVVCKPKPKLIKFYIENYEFIAEKEMTFTDWIFSEYYVEGVLMAPNYDLDIKSFINQYGDDYLLFSSGGYTHTPIIYLRDIIIPNQIYKTNPPI